MSSADPGKRLLWHGLLLVLLGLAWPRLVLSARARVALLWSALYGAYVNWACTLLGAVLGTNRRTLFAGAGFGANAWQEQLVEVGLVTLSLAIIAAIALTVWGLRSSRDS